MAEEKKRVMVFHPTLPGVRREVDAASVKQWTEAGWRKTEPKNSR